MLGDGSIVTINDKPLFDEYLSEGKYENSELSFTNLFMWCDSWNIRFYHKDDILFLEGRDLFTGVPFHFTPLVHDKTSLNKAVHMAKDDFLKRGLPFVMRCIPKSVKDDIEECCPGMFVVSEDRDNFDYVYRSVDLIKLEGKHYHGKRNHINKFKSIYSYEYKEITEADIEPCIESFKRWQAQRITDRVGDLHGEELAIRKIIGNLTALNAKAGAISINGRIEAFSVGGPISKSLAAIHTEKANVEFPGLFSLINQQFCEHAWADHEFINREEDMGLPGLRRSKESYYPVKLIEKYTMILK